jgi:hypothetical protein
MPAAAHGDMRLDAPVWEHDTNQDEHIDADEGVRIEADLGVKVEWKHHLYAYNKDTFRVKLTVI